MEANACLGCRFGSVKIDILAPQKYDSKKLAEETRAFASAVTALTKQKPIHYAVTISELKKSAIDFKVNCSCILNLEKTDCSNYNPSKTCRIKHLHLRKPPSIEATHRIC
jgi:hypothetical protein